MFRLMGKNIITIKAQKFCITGTMDYCCQLSPVNPNCLALVLRLYKVHSFEKNSSTLFHNLSQLSLFADIQCKEFGPRSGTTQYVRPDLDILKIILKYFK